MSSRRRSLKTRRSRTTSNSAPPESRELRRGWSGSTLGEARGDLLLCARENSLQEEGGVADFSGLIRDAMEARADFWSMSGGFFYCHFVMPREHLYVPKDSSFPIPSKYVDVVRQTKTNLAGSVVIYVQMRSKEAKQQWDTARRKQAIKNFIPDEVEEFDTIFRNARKKLEIPVAPAMLWVTRIHIPTAKTQTQNVAVSIEETPALSEAITLADLKAYKSVRVPDVSSSQRAKSFA